MCIRDRSYISEHGFNNGVDCAAMPAIAAWDHYITTGDIQLLYEMLPGIIKYAEEADARYDEEMQLVHATMCLAQDAFEEPENGGYCLGTEIAFALMYQDVARICEVTGCYPERIKFWESRSKEMLASIKEKYWNEEKECFTSGPIAVSYTHLKEEDFCPVDPEERIPFEETDIDYKQLQLNMNHGIKGI